MMNQEIIFGLSGQQFFYDAPEGRPSLASVQVFFATTGDNGTAEAATSGDCTIDPVDTTLSGAAVEGGQTLELVDTTDVARGRRYLLVDADDGHSEWVEVLSKGTTVRLRQPLKNDYAIGSAFQGCRILVDVDATWVASQAKLTDILGTAWNTAKEAQPWVPGAAGYRLRWSYTADGAVQLGVSFADLVRYQAKNLVTPLDVDRRFPGWIDRLPTDYQADQGVALVAEAFQAMRMDCLGDEQLVRRMRNTEILRELVIYRANVTAHEAAIFAGGGNKDALQLAEQRYERRYKQLIREPKIPTDQSSDGSSNEPRRSPVFRR